MAPKGRQQVMAKTETTGHGKIKIKSHGKIIIKTKVINPATLALLCHRIKKFFVPADCDENTFQTICTLVKAQIDRAKQSSGNSKEINEISKDTLVNLLNISDETYDAAQAAVQQAAKDDTFAFFIFDRLTMSRIRPPVHT